MRSFPGPSCKALRLGRARFRHFGAVPAMAVLVVAALVGLPTPALGDDGEIAKVKAQAEKAAQDLSNAETAIADIESKMGVIQNRTDQASAKIESLRKDVHAAVIDQYVAPQASRLPLDADFEAGLRKSIYGEFLSRDGNDAIDAFEAVSEDLTVARSELDAQQRALDETTAQLKSSQERLNKELKRLEELELKRQEEEAKRKAAADAAAAAKVRTDKANAAKPKVSGPTPAPTRSNRPAPVFNSGGGMVCPVAGAVSFIDSWGFARSGGRRHQGVDMMARTGVPVVAPVSGTVTHRGNSVGGLSFHLSGDDGNYYYGTHLSGYENQNAGHVAAGTVVGYVGDSGNARGIPHLHFEIHPNHGSAVNPYPATKAACG